MSERSPELLLETFQDRHTFRLHDLFLEISGVLALVVVLHITLVSSELASYYV